MPVLWRGSSVEFVEFFARDAFLEASLVCSCFEGLGEEVNLFEIWLLALRLVFLLAFLAAREELTLFFLF